LGLVFERRRPPVVLFLFYRRASSARAGSNANAKSAPGPAVHAAVSLLASPSSRVRVPAVSISERGWLSDVVRVCRAFPSHAAAMQGHRFTACSLDVTSQNQSAI
jgi:hypothetical protein